LGAKSGKTLKMEIIVTLRTLKIRKKREGVSRGNQMTVILAAIKAKTAHVQVKMASVLVSERGCAGTANLRREGTSKAGVKVEPLQEAAWVSRSSSPG